jgi:hypothetical protein
MWGDDETDAALLKEMSSVPAFAKADAERA